jgi:hypothetical protein
MVDVHAQHPGPQGTLQVQARQPLPKRQQGLLAGVQGIVPVAQQTSPDAQQILLQFRRDAAEDPLLL